MEFFDNGKNPIVQRYFCAFLDILGFKEKIKECGEDKKKLNTLLKNFYGILKTEQEKLRKRSKRDRNFIFKIFSDNVCIAYRAPEADTEMSYAKFAYDIASYQLEMALKGFFIRGGISLNYLFIDDKIIFGPALIEAYEMESTKAKYPKIILSGEVSLEVFTHISFYGERSQTRHSKNLCSDDSKFFFDNLKRMKNNKNCSPSDNSGLFINYLERLKEKDSEIYRKLKIHKNQILLNLEKYKKEYDCIEVNKEAEIIKCVIKKYEWLVDYHNFFCKSIKDYDNFDIDCFIEKEYEPERFNSLEDFLNEENPIIEDVINKLNSNYIEKI